MEKILIYSTEGRKSPSEETVTVYRHCDGTYLVGSREHGVIVWDTIVQRPLTEEGGEIPLYKMGLRVPTIDSDFIQFCWENRDADLTPRSLSPYFRLLPPTIVMWLGISKIIRVRLTGFPGGLANALRCGCQIVFDVEV